MLLYKPSLQYFFRRKVHELKLKIKDPCKNPGADGRGGGGGQGV